MKKSISIIAAGMVLLLAACNDNNDTNAAESVIVETSVGNITEEELVEALKDIHGEEVLSTLIHDKVLSQDAEEFGITDEDVEEEIESLKEGFGIQSETEFLQLLQMQGLSSEEELRTMILSHLVLEHHIGHVGDATEEELMDEYELGEEVEARHILVDTEEEAMELYERIQAGEDFEDLAREYSTEPGADDSAGNLGFFRRGHMLAPFEEAAFRLEVGEISPPVQSFYGYHLIEVTDRNHFEEDFETVRQTLETAYNNRKAHKMSQKQAELLGDIDIKVLDERFKSLEGELEELEEIEQ